NPSAPRSPIRPSPWPVVRAQASRAGPVGWPACRLLILRGVSHAPCLDAGRFRRGHPGGDRPCLDVLLGCPPPDRQEGRRSREAHQPADRTGGAILEWGGVLPEGGLGGGRLPGGPVLPCL